MSDSKTTYIDITPHTSLMTKIGQSGYTLAEALAELIDNALDARLPNQPVTVSISLSDQEIKVTDDATGMTEAEAHNAIRLGFSEKREQLGEFGVGLKTACLFLGERFEVVTSTKSDPHEYIIVFDEQEWLESGKWNQFPFGTQTKRKSQQHGTTVTIERLKVGSVAGRIEALTQALSQRFAPYLRNQELRLTINDAECTPSEPTLISGRTPIELSQDGVSVTGWWGHQLRGPDQSSFGFHTHRRGRLVTTNDKLGLNPNQPIKQIVGEIELDGVEIATNKKNWQIGTAAYQTAQALLYSYFSDKQPALTTLVSGYAASAGLVYGRARIIDMLLKANIEAETQKITAGDILITTMTRPQFILPIRRAGAIVTDLGGNLCHAAIVAREFGIPAVVGTGRATTTIKDGQMIIVDATNGIVYDA